MYVVFVFVTYIYIYNYKVYKFEGFLNQLKNDEMVNNYSNNCN